MGTSRSRPESDVEETDVLEGAIVLGDLVERYFGPDGRYTLIEDGEEPTVASDLHALLDELSIEHPGATMLANGAVSQKETVGDGSQAVVLLGRSLAERTRELLDDGYHRATISAGFDRARDVVHDRIDDSVIDHVSLDDPRGRAAVGNVLEASVRTESIVDLAIETAELLSKDGAGGIDRIDFHHAPASDVTNARLLRGVVLNREPVTINTPTSVDDPRIAVIGGGKKAGRGIEERELKRQGGSTGKGRTEIDFGAETPDDHEAFRAFEEADVRDQVERLVELNVDVVFATMGISDRAISALDRAGILAFRNLMSEHATTMARATGATVVMHLDDISADDLGVATGVEVVTHGDETFVRVEGGGEATVGTILLSGPIETGIEAIQRDITTAIITARAFADDEAIVAGGGGIQSALAQSIRSAATAASDRSAIVMEAYADGLDDLPRVLARNAAADPLTVTTELRAGPTDAVFDAERRTVRSAGTRGPFERASVVRSTIDTATAVAIQLVRIDEVLAANPPSDDVEDFDLRPDPERDVD